MVQSQVLAMVRGATERFLTQRCLLEAETTSQGTYGEPLHEWAVVAENLPCRIILPGQRYGSGIAEAGGAETMKTEFRLIVRRGVALAADQRVTVDGVTYHVVRIETVLTDEAFHSAIIVRRD
jgi:head-tail adaptor